MDAILSMPVPMATALMVLAAMAAFFFIKVVALIVTPSYGRNRDRQRQSRYDRRMADMSGRRESDGKTARDIAHC